MTQPDPELYRYVDGDGFCLSARLLIDLNTGGVTETLSITIEGSDEPQSVHVRASDAPTLAAGIVRAAGQQPAEAVVVSPPADRADRYATAIHDAMETDLSLVDQEPAFQALIARAAEAAVALADAELQQANRPDRAEVLAATPAGPTPATDRAARVAVIYDALAGLQGGPHHLPAGTRQAIAEHLAAVLPAPDQQTAAARVRALHQQYRFAGDDTTDYCAHCNQISGGWIPWPCPTVQALDGERATGLRRLAGEAQQDEAPDDTLHACPGRWGGPDCRCFDDGQPAREAQQPPCGECGHPAAGHEEGDDPVTPGTCTLCPEDEAHHDYRTSHDPAQGDEAREAAEYARVLATPPSAEAAVYIRDRLAELAREAQQDPTQDDEAVPPSTAPLASGLPLVKGNCPACRRASLFLGTGGYPTCSNHECPEPDAATTVLEQPAAVARFGQPETD
ncbi:hypothetical protein [Streptomyces sp. SCL15-4]|uniref:hypothetical protein n=1 Tax=Streptomyces sp. SCL15-4 TaxID=2967221 RepID=UPI002965D1AB|nr:hypothetical protein [Streptomyces sp. SCL15-4]